MRQTPKIGFTFLIIFILSIEVSGQSMIVAPDGVKRSEFYVLFCKNELEISRNDVVLNTKKFDKRKVENLCVAAYDDTKFAQVDLAKYPNLKLLCLDNVFSSEFTPDYNGRLHFDEKVRFSGGIGYIPNLWPLGLSKDTQLLYVSIGPACSYDECEPSVLLSLPSYLLSNKSLRWLDAYSLSVHYIQEDIGQCENLTVLALEHQGEMPFIPLNLFRCQRLSYLCLSERNKNRPEFVFLRQIHQNGDKIEISGSYGSGDVGWGDEFTYHMQSNMPLQKIELTKKVELYSEDNKQLLISGQITGGLLEGKWELWHPNGKPAQERYYIHGKETGVWRAWDTTGFLKAEYTFSDTGRTEISYTKYSDGETKKNTLNYNLEGMAHGKWSIEMKSSSSISVAPEHTYIFIEQNYINGQQQGVAYFKFEDGTGKEFVMKDGHVESKKDF